MTLYKVQDDTKSAEKHIELASVVDVESRASTDILINNLQLIKPRHRVSHLYLSFFAGILSLASATQVGYGISENGQIGFVLAQKLGWN
jgi:hypothetical protein